MPVSINTDGNNYIRCLGNTTTQNWQMTSGGVNSVNIARNAIVTGTVYKSVFAYANNDTVLNHSTAQLWVRTILRPFLL